VVVDDAGKGAALLAADGDDEAAVAQGNERLLDHVGETGFLEESFQAALDGMLELSCALAQGVQGGAGAVEDRAVGIEAAMEVGAQARAEVGPGGESAQGGAGEAGLAVEEAGDLSGGVEEGAHEEQLRAIEDGACRGNAAEDCFGVVEEDSRQGGTGIEDGEHIGVQIRTGSVGIGAGGWADGVDDGATARRLGIAADGVEEGAELEDCESVLVHQRRGL
jgi:hypothetical protein